MLAAGSIGSAVTLPVNHVAGRTSDLTPLGLQEGSALSKFSSSLILAQIMNFTNSVEGPSPWSFLTARTELRTIGGIVVNENISSVSSNDSHTSRTAGEPSWKMHGQNFRQSSTDTLEMINKQFSRVVDPFAIAIGIVGNALLALVFLITPLRLRPMSHAMASLGIINLLYTLSSLLVYLTNLNVQVYQVPGVCQISTFILTLTRSLEAWYIFMVHLNRLSAHTASGHERRRRRVFNTKFALVVVALFVGAPLLNLFWSVETVEFAGRSHCVPMRETMPIHLILKKIELITTVLLPMTLTGGVDLMLLLKFAMYWMFKEEEEEDEDYDNNDKKYHSSFCADKIIKMPVQESLKDYSSLREYPNNFCRTDDFSSCLSHTPAYQLKVVKASCHEILSDCSIQISVSKNGKRKSMSSCPGTEIKDEMTTLKPIFTSHSSIELSTVCNMPSAVVSETNSIDELGMESETFKSTTQLSFTNNTISKTNSSSKICNDIEKQSKSDLNARNLSEDSSCIQVKRIPEIKSSKIDKVISETSTNKCNAVGLLLNNMSISKCEQRDTVQVSFKPNSYKSKNKTYSKNNNTSLNMAHWRSYDFTSCASNVTIRSQDIPEDHEFPADIVACTIATILMGFAYMVLVVPSSYKQGVKLFFDSPSSRPSFQDIQLAIFFESLVKINAVYKFIMCVVMLSSFRHAILWLLTHWIPSKITRMSSICLWGSEKESNIVSMV